MRWLREKWLVLGWVFLALLVPSVGQAAGTIFLTPDKVTHSLGTDFDITLELSTGGQMVKKVEGVISFDNTLLRVKSISTNTTVVDSWLVEPTFVNNRGKISFVGLLNNDTGDSLSLFVVSFASRQLGVAQISVSSGQVIGAGVEANNIAGALGSAMVTIENPLSYDLEPTALNVNQADGISAGKLAELRIVSAEILYRLLLISAGVLVLGLNWWLSQNRGTKKPRRSRRV